MAILICLWLALVLVMGAVGGFAVGFAAKGRQWSEKRRYWTLCFLMVVLWSLGGYVVLNGDGEGHRSFVTALPLLLSFALARQIARKIAAPK
jgi:hypothetical protein